MREGVFLWLLSLHPVVAWLAPAQALTDQLRLPRSEGSRLHSSQVSCREEAHKTPADWLDVPIQASEQGLKSRTIMDSQQKERLLTSRLEGRLLLF